MKKLLIYSLILISGFVLPACGDDDDVQPSAKATGASIDGKWFNTRVETQEFDANNNQIGQTKSESMYPNLIYTFNAPSELKVEQSGSTTNGTYALNGSELKITTNTTSTVQVDSLTTTRLVYHATIPASSLTNRYVVTYRFKR